MHQLAGVSAILACRIVILYLGAMMRAVQCSPGVDQCFLVCIIRWKPLGRGLVFKAVWSQAHSTYNIADLKRIVPGESSHRRSKWSSSSCAQPTVPDVVYSDTASIACRCGLRKEHISNDGQGKCT
ncbi:hypothetical protein ARMSODRAFT_958122 [Armillaria solidipes]|uniref:Secreted protein n=1 Tax=Armillaria solidipes TaxID=1076256 RepID=A0A2H3BFH1_9AGAR|nr:hypothetical protein ARMSODRAFT_958122 [Armillaria solidipes]